MIIGCFFLMQCSTKSRYSDETNGELIDFGCVDNYKMSDIISEHALIKLDSKESLIGEISQLEIHDDKIYILDQYNTRSLFVFSMEGRFINKIEGTGNGPGEFISPHSFYVDTQGAIFIYDMQLKRLLKYASGDLSFIEEIVLPDVYPLSFSIIPEDGTYVYYCKASSVKELNNKQLILADKSGKIVGELWDVPASGKVLHGNSGNLYSFDGHIHFYPYFSNKIYTLKNDSLECSYSLSWGDRNFAEEDLFKENDDSKKIMHELMNGGKERIRFMSVHETLEHLLVRYYVRKEIGISIYNKRTGKAKNFDRSSVVDDIGIGGVCPIPKATYKDKFIGFIHPHEIKPEMVKDENLKKMLQEDYKEDNPILVLYSLKD
jgi:hypothetical protein